jgi:hypothetical protein
MPTATGVFIKWMDGMSSTGVSMGDIQYGLIEPDNEDMDVMVHKSLLQNETIMRYTRVVYEAEYDLSREMWICTSIVVDKSPPPPSPLWPPPEWIHQIPRATEGEPAHKQLRRQ